MARGDWGWEDMDAWPGRKKNLNVSFPDFS